MNLAYGSLILIRPSLVVTEGITFSPFVACTMSWCDTGLRCATPGLCLSNRWIPWAARQQVPAECPCSHSSASQVSLTTSAPWTWIQDAESKSYKTGRSSWPYKLHAESLIRVRAVLCMSFSSWAKGKETPVSGSHQLVTSPNEILSREQSMSLWKPILVIQATSAASLRIFQQL